MINNNQNYQFLLDQIHIIRMKTKNILMNSILMLGWDSDHMFFNRFIIKRLEVILMPKRYMKTCFVTFSWRKCYIWKTFNNSYFYIYLFMFLKTLICIYITHMYSTTSTSCKLILIKEWTKSFHVSYFIWSYYIIHRKIIWFYIFNYFFKIFFIQILLILFE